VIHDLDVRRHGRPDAVRNRVGEALLFPQHVVDPDDVARRCPANHQGSPSRVGKGNQGAKHGPQGGQVSLELQSLALRRGEKVRDRGHVRCPVSSRFKSSGRARTAPSPRCTAPLKPAHPRCSALPTCPPLYPNSLTAR